MSYQRRKIISALLFAGIALVGTEVYGAMEKPHYQRQKRVVYANPIE
ncbi:hypothetical protein [Paenibacillus phytorum]|nr:hypothetical protein [Paenibacillus phytorum]